MHIYTAEARSTAWLFKPTHPHLDSMSRVRGRVGKGDILWEYLAHRQKKIIASLGWFGHWGQGLNRPEQLKSRNEGSSERGETPKEAVQRLGNLCPQRYSTVDRTKP